MTLAMHTVHKTEKTAAVFLAVQQKPITMLVFKKKCRPNGPSFQKMMVALCWKDAADLPDPTEAQFKS